MHMPPSPPDNPPSILTLNGGSSTIKFAVFSPTSPPTRLFAGHIERIGTPQPQLTTTSGNPPLPETSPITGKSFDDCLQAILIHLKQQLGPSSLAAVGHRIVHGGLHLIEHQLVTEDLLAELRRSQPLDLTHLPREIALIEAFRLAFPAIPHIACFDTAFHQNLPRIAQLLPIPRHFQNAGLRRFGFHGLSYSYLMSRLTAIAGPVVADGRIILAHLGSGASMAAVHRGKPVDTTMSFTPASGLVMGTRPGDFDPGLLIYLMKDQKLSADEMENFIAGQCGLLGVSEISSDIRDLLAVRATDPRAADAVDLFCHQAKKHLCAMAATLAGLDTLVFAGGIGEHSPEIRAAICNGLEFLGLNLDPSRNARNHDIISTDTSRVTVRVIPTDEESMIAQLVQTLLLQGPL